MLNLGIMYPLGCGDRRWNSRLTMRVRTASRKPGPQNTKHCGSIAAIVTMRALPSTASERGVEEDFGRE